MTLNPEEEKYVEALQKNEEIIKSQLDFEQLNKSQKSAFEQEHQTSMLREQINCKGILEDVEHWLREETRELDENEKEVWVCNVKPQDIILTDLGVKKLMSVLKMYVNPNTLLSNYSEDTIMEKMEDIGTDISDDFFMLYDKYYRYLTQEEIHELFEDKMKKELQRRMLNYSIKGVKFDEKELAKQILDEVDIEREKEIIDNNHRKEKHKTYPLIMRQMQDVIHSAYLRALGGQERRTLRQNISESTMHHTQEGKAMGERKKFMDLFKK